MNPQVSIVKCDSYELVSVLEAVEKSLDLIGGVENFIKPGSRVLIKPNLLMAIEPESGVDTHPQVVRALVRLLKSIGCTVSIGDGPSAWGNQAGDMDKLYDKSGMKRVCDEEGASLLKADNRRWHGKFPLLAWTALECRPVRSWW